MVASWVRVADELPCEVWERVNAITIVMRRLIIVYAPLWVFVQGQTSYFSHYVDDGGKE